MKRSSLLCLLLFFLIPLGAETRYFRSNWVGLEMEVINRVRLDEFEYVLSVTKNAEKTVKTLFNKQKEWKRWEIIFDTHGQKKEEHEYENNLLTLHLIYDRRGRIKTEYQFLKGVLQDKLIYSYSSRGVDFVNTYDANDKLKYTDEYQLAPSGRLRSMRRIFPDGTVAVIHFTYGEGIMVGEWEYRDGRIFDSKYNENGQIQHTEQWDKDELVATKEYTYDQQSGKLIKETEQQVADNTKRERHYDQEGNLVSETEGAADKTPVEYTYTYDGDKRVSTRKKSDIGVEEWRFFYDGDGSLKKEEYYRRGFLQMQTVYTGEDSWYEELFHNDEVIIRIYFDKEKKVREEFIQDGNVVRTKEY